MLFRSPGCQECKLTGYVDRVAVAEVFTPTDAMRAAIAKGITALELKQMMKEAGHRSMRDAALRLVDEGVTSLEEINRVLAEGEGERAKTTGKKTSAIAAWLNTLGFVGTGATVNGFLYVLGMRRK